MLLLVAATFAKFVFTYNMCITYEYIFIFRVGVTEAQKLSYSFTSKLAINVSEMVTIIR